MRFIRYDHETCGAASGHDAGGGAGDHNACDHDTRAAGPPGDSAGDDDAADHEAGDHQAGDHKAGNHQPADGRRSLVLSRRSSLVAPAPSCLGS
ncbi:MAG TPA: hypothetical protein VKQ71_03205 [Acidimicrobiales bacterium]|nr:hypothetical protein [Acidimicrobiales bacterium]